MDKNNLSGWLTHFNKYTGNFEAVKREHFYELFSGDKGNVLRSPDISTLHEVIMLTGGDKDKIKALTDSPFLSDPLI